MNTVLDRETQNEQSEPIAKYIQHILMWYTDINKNKRKRSISQVDQDNEGPGPPEI